MNITVSVPIESDSDNSFPTDRVEFELDAQQTSITISGGDNRRVSVATQDLKQLLKLLEAQQ